MRRVVLAALLALGCYAEPPAPAMPGELSGCHPGSYAALSDLRCSRDEDCLLCALDEEPCGALTTRARLELTNGPCPRVDADACAGALARCCERRCVRALGPPRF